MTIRKVRPTDVDEMVSLFEDGTGLKEIAEATGFHRSTVAQHLQCRGIDNRRHARRLTDAEIDEMVQRQKGGFSLVAIGEHFGVHSSAVSYRVKQRDVSFRAPSHR